VAQRPADTREVMHDKVPQARIYRVWNVAEVGTTDIDQLQLFAQLLGGSKSSRLDKRLLHEDKLVDSISAMAGPSQLGSNFIIMASVKQGVDPKKVEAIIDEELDKLVAEGPTAAELAQAKTMFRAGFIRGIERIGGFGGKADALASCTIYEGDPGCFRKSLDTIEDTSADELKAVGAKWLGVGDHTLVVEPGERTPLAEEPTVKPAPMTLPPVDPKYTVEPSAVDRSKGVPVPSSFPDLKFPELQRATLENGSKVILAERHDIPVVQMSYEFKGGSASDAKATLGAASFTMGMLDEGAGDLGSLAFGNRAESLGASLGAGASLDGSNAYLSALKENLDPSVALFATMLRQPRFDQGEIDRVKASWIAGIKQEKARPNGAAMRVLPPLLYGEGHPYAIPFSGTGTEASIAALGRDDLLAYQHAWVRPENATVIVVGDTTLKDIVPVLNRHFGDWKGEGAAPQAVSVSRVARPDKPRVFLIDQPGAVQANIFAGEVVPSTMDPKAVEFEIANDVLGGQFSSRLNMNLREDKHWAYGAYSFVSGAIGQRPWMAYAPVQIDKTVDSLKEMRSEIDNYVDGSKPATQAEVEKIKATEIRGLPGAYETARSVMSTIGGIVRYDRPDDYVFKRKAEVESLTPAQVRAAAGTIDPKALTWVVVGDLDKIEQPVRALGLGEVSIVDADGKPVADAPADKGGE
jgi:predicted Zn-dependent peptidase